MLARAHGCSQCEHLTVLLVLNQPPPGLTSVKCWVTDKTLQACFCKSLVCLVYSMQCIYTRSIEHVHILPTLSSWGQKRREHSCLCMKSNNYDSCWMVTLLQAAWGYVSSCCVRHTGPFNIICCWDFILVQELSTLSDWNFQLWAEQMRLNKICFHYSSHNGEIWIVQQHSGHRDWGGCCKDDVAGERWTRSNLLKNKFN